MAMQLLVRVLKDGYGYHDDHKKDDLIYMNLTHINDEIKKGHVEIVCNNIGDNLEYDIKPNLVDPFNDIQTSLKGFIIENKSLFHKDGETVYLESYNKEVFQLFMDSFEKYIDPSSIQKIIHFNLQISNGQCGAECKLMVIDSETHASNTLFEGII
ncbi:hypothetical protein C2I27_03860 [Priestia megaterium]|uniref:hypothetical protein n=1 Tax=Priestia megaterium TaxID=1404 RepID=UPI000D515068|nr:hypothetical protein [Priestia megaterium]PVC75032.1 hypothetical protein C2I27_03860 [Priestia megaterium]